MSRNIEEHNTPSEIRSGSMRSMLDHGKDNRVVMPKENNTVRTAFEDIKSTGEIGIQLNTLRKKMSVLDTSKAVEFSHRIWAFFKEGKGGVKGDANNPHAFLEQITAEIDTEYKKKLN